MAILVGLRFLCDACGLSFPYETTPAVSRAEMIAEARRLAEAEGWQITRHHVDPARVYPEAIMWDTMNVEIRCPKCHTQVQDDDDLDAMMGEVMGKLARVRFTLRRRGD